MQTIARETENKLQEIQQTEINKLVSKFLDDVFEKQASTKLKLKKMVIENSLGKTNLVNKQIEPIDKPLS